MCETAFPVTAVTTACHPIPQLAVLGDGGGVRIRCCVADRKAFPGPWETPEPGFPVRVMPCVDCFL